MTPAELITLLRSLEWSGQTACAPFYMGGSTPWYAQSCPVCRGVNRDGPHGKGEFNESAFGHRKNCKLNKAITEGVTR